MIVVEDLRCARGSFQLCIEGRLVLEPGICLVVGANGAGKSTFLELLATATPPDRGRILYDGRRLEEDVPGIRRRIGYLPADLEPYGRMTPRRFLVYMAHLKGLEPEGEAELALERLGLRAVADVRIARLSEGMRKRVGLAQALLGSPSLLFLDEPLSQLETPRRQEVIRFLTRYARPGSGRSLVVVSHEPDEWEAAGQIVWLEAGRVAFSGPPALWTAGLGSRVWCGTADAAFVQRLDPERLLRCAWLPGRARAEVRLFAPEPPGEGFQPAEPTREEAYVIRRAALRRRRREERR
ncbi:MAG: ABC transporter ATP-binding protein [Bacillota bacterium]|nr:ABC transporter ATP-binding protein [Bacillota bacterium]